MGTCVAPTIDMDRQLAIGAMLGASGLIATAALLVPSPAPTTSARHEAAHEPSNDEPRGVQPRSNQTVSNQTVTYTQPTAFGGGPSAEDELAAASIPTATANAGKSASGSTMVVSTEGSAVVDAGAPPDTYVAPDALEPEVPDEPDTSPVEDAAPAATDANQPDTGDPIYERYHPGELGIPSSGGFAISDAGVAYDPNVPIMVPLTTVPIVPTPAPVDFPAGGVGAGAVPPTTAGAGGTTIGANGAGGGTQGPSVGSAGGSSVGPTGIPAGGTQGGVFIGPNGTFVGPNGGFVGPNGGFVGPNGGFVTPNAFGTGGTVIIRR
jgi:hypothetical protein